MTARSNIIAAHASRGGREPYTRRREVTLRAEVFDHVGERWVRLTTRGLGPTIEHVLRYGEWLALVGGVARDRLELDGASEPRTNSPEDIGWRKTG